MKDSAATSMKIKKKIRKGFAEEVVEGKKDLEDLLEELSGQFSDKIKFSGNIF